MANIKFDDYLNNEFKNGYLTEKAILKSALVI
ncbi:MAG: transcriptional regulator, partial [Lachnospiraceae bacterium]